MREPRYRHPEERQRRGIPECCAGLRVKGSLGRGPRDDGRKGRKPRSGRTATPGCPAVIPTRTSTGAGWRTCPACPPGPTPSSRREPGRWTGATRRTRRSSAWSWASSASWSATRASASSGGGPGLGSDEPRTAGVSRLIILTSLVVWLVIRRTGRHGPATRPQERPPGRPPSRGAVPGWSPASPAGLAGSRKCYRRVARTLNGAAWVGCQSRAAPLVLARGAGTLQ